MRHAKSAWDDPTLSDHARPLNARGQAGAEVMRRAMLDYGLLPDLVLVSSARRAMQTLEALEPWPAAPLVDPMDALYMADAAQLLAVLRAVAATVRSVLLVGHNPGLHEFAVALVEAGTMSVENPLTRRLAAGFPTGGLAEFAVPSGWAGLDAGGARLLRFLTPRDLGATAG